MRYLCSVAVMAITMLAATLLPAEEKIQIARITQKNKPHAEKTPVALETPVIELRVPDESKKDALKVTIYGAIHIGEQSYYDTLQKAFGKHQVVLYELVGPKGAKPTTKGGNNPLSILQSAMGDALGLTHQLTAINYEAKNFVHADMSPEEISAAMRNRGDDAMTMALGIFLDMQRAQNKLNTRVQEGKASEEDLAVLKQAESFENLLQVLQKKGGAKELKLNLARSVAISEQFLGQTIGQYLIQDRNEACCRVLASQINAGKTDIAIFYGSGHIPDFVPRLEKRFKLKPTQTTWIEAIDLTTAPEEAPLDLVMQRFQRQMVADIMRNALEDPEMRKLARELLDLLDKK